jgi:hypothetical protein
MKKIICFTAIAFLTLSSCRKEGATLANGPILAQSQSQASTSRSTGAVPFSDVFIVSLVGESGYNPCTNEVMTVTSGKIMIDVHGIYNGNKSTITIHANGQEQKAVGESGRQYVLTGSYNEQTNDFSNGEFTTKLMHFDRWTTPGNEYDAIIKDIYYIKVDAEGNVTIVRDETHEVSCR